METLLDRAGALLLQVSQKSPIENRYCLLEFMEKSRTKTPYFLEAIDTL